MAPFHHRSDHLRTSTTCTLIWNILSLQEYDKSQSLLIHLAMWYRYLDHNRLSSPLPSFLQTKPPVHNIVDIRSNAFVRSRSCVHSILVWSSSSLKATRSLAHQQGCPLPSWCDAPPKGNGMCTPCGMAPHQLKLCVTIMNGQHSQEQTYVLF